MRARRRRPSADGLAWIVDGGHTWPSSTGSGECFGLVSCDLDTSAEAIAFIRGLSRG